MKEHYKLQKPTGALSVDLESDVLEHIQAMANHMGYETSAIVNVAMKRFIAMHKDFFPPKYWDPKPKNQ